MVHEFNLISAEAEVLEFEHSSEIVSHLEMNLKLYESDTFSNAELHSLDAVTPCYMLE